MGEERIRWASHRPVARVSAVTRLLVSVEGETEDLFVYRILAPHLYARGYTSVVASPMGTAVSRDKRGGVKAWADVLKDIVNKLRGDRGLIVSTMVDYYGMPRDWPGRGAVPPSGATPSQIAGPIEQGMLDAVVGEIGSDFDASRFVPYVMMHEFEAMLFSDCNGAAIGIGLPELTPRLQAIRDRFDTPEAIDDSPTNAPSKRIEGLVSSYRKPLMGMDAVEAIGLEAIRGECPHFAGWVARLERAA